MTPAFAWALAATVAAGVQVFSQRMVAQERRSAGLNGSIGFSLSALITGTCFVLFSSVPTRWEAVALISFSAGAMLAASSYYRIEALKNIDSVLYFPINKVLGPLIAVFAGIAFLHEHLTPAEIVGIGLSMLVPVLLISPGERGRQGSLQWGLLFLIISTVLAAITAPMQKVVTNMTSELLFPLLMWQLAAVAGSIILYRYASPTTSAGFTFDRRDVYLGLLNGILQFASAFAFIKAVSLGQVSIFYVIHAHYILIPIILSIFFYGDHINIRKSTAIIVSLFALTFLAI